MSDDAIYGDNSELAQLISAGAKQMVDQARALGLTWTLRLATIGNSAGDSLTAIFDGDSTPIPVTNMAGRPIISDERVYILIIPPSGNFIIGSPLQFTPVALRARAPSFVLPGGGYTPVTWTSRDSSTGAWASVPTSTFSFPTDGVYAITANMQMDTPGVVNSIQGVGIVVASGLSGWAVVSYRCNWGLGENADAVTAIVQVQAGDSFTVEARQNSAVSMVVDGYLTVALVA